MKSTFVLFVAFIITFSISAQVTLEDICQNATEISIETSLEAPVWKIDSESTFRQNECFLSPIHSYSLIKIEGTGDLLQFTSCSSLGGALVFIGDCEESRCLATYYTEPAFDCLENTIFQTAKGETYYVLFVIQNRNISTTLLSVKSIQRPANDICAQAETLTIGEKISLDFVLSSPISLNTDCDNFEIRRDLWFNLEGTGATYVFRRLYPSTPIIHLVQFFKNECSALECADPYFVRHDLTFDTEKGVSYKIRMIMDVSQSSDTLLVMGLNSPENKRCENATALSQTGQYSYSMSNVESENILCGDDRHDARSLWYRFKGNGAEQSFKIEFFNGHNAFFYKGSCGNLECLDHSENGNILSIQTEENSDYYINLYSLSPSLNDETFTFIYNQGSIPPNDDIQNAIPISCFETLEGTLVNATNDNEYEPGGAIWYKVVGNDQLYQFDFGAGLSSQLYANVYVGLENKERIPPLLNGYYLKKGETYYVAIASYRSYEEASFHIRLNCFPTAPNDLCSGATLLSCGDVITDSTSYLSSDVPSCDFRQHNYGLWYQFQGNDQYVRVNLNDYVDQSRLVIFKGECTSLLCNDEVIYDENSAIFWAKNGTNYFIYIFNIPKYTFDIECIPPPTNNDIESAPLVQCGDTIQSNILHATHSLISSCQFDNEDVDIWYRIIGNDQLLYINPNTDSYYNLARIEGIYTLRNGIYECLGPLNQERVFLNKDVVYFIRFAHQNTRAYVGTVNYILSCAPKVENNNCVGALVLKCNESITADNTHSDNLVNIPNCNFNNSDRTTWYKITGDNSFKKINIAPSLGFSFQTAIYEGSCNNLNCLTTNSFFFGEEGKDYFILVTSHYVGEFEIYTVCSEEEQNIECQNAQNISYGELITNKMDFVKPSEVSSSDQQGIRKLWYSFVGNGNLTRIQIQSSNNIIIDNVKKGCCTSESQIIYGDEQNKWFQTELGQEYFFTVRENYSQPNSDFELTLQSQSNSIGVSTCENASMLVEGEELVLSSKEQSAPCRSFSCDEWIRFVGSGGMDTIFIKNTAGGFSNHPELFYYLDYTSSCNLSPAFQNSINHLNGRIEEYPHSVALKTLKGKEYVIKLQHRSDIGPSYTFVLKSDQNIEQECSLEIPNVITEADARLPFEYDLLNSDGNEWIFLLGQQGGPEFYTADVKLVDFINKQGFYTIEYFTSNCRGHNFFFYDLKENTTDCSEDSTNYSNIAIETFVLLEGAYDTLSETMETTLNDLQYLPGQKPSTFLGTNAPAGQPYHLTPWRHESSEGKMLNYENEGLDNYAGYDEDVVDYVLVSLRTENSANSVVCKTAALLNSDGSLDFFDDFDCKNIDTTLSYYILLEHRNHLPVMSHEKLNIVNGKICYDFRLQNSFTSSLGKGQKIINGQYTMYAGNGEQNSSTASRVDINIKDKSFLVNQMGLNSSYYLVDYDLNGDVNTKDAVLAERNNGIFTDVKF